MLTYYGNKLDRIINQAFPETVVKLRPKELVEQIILDPEISGLDIIVTYITALKGINQEIRNIKKALTDRHPLVKAIVLIDDARSENIIKDETIYKFSVPKNFNSDDLKYAVENILESINLDNDIYSAEDEIKSDIKEYEEQEEYILDEVENNEMENKDDELEFECETTKGIFSEEIEIPEETISEQNKIKIEQINLAPQSQDILDVNDYPTLQEIGENIDKNRIYKELLSNNVEFFNTNESLRVLDVQLSTVFHDKKLSLSEKLCSMQGIVLNRAILKGKSNGIFTEYLSNIINHIIDITTQYIDEEIQKMKCRFANISDKELYKGNSELISKLCKERCHLQENMSENLVRIFKLYNHLTSTVLESQETFVEGITSSNPYINSYLSPSIGIAPADLSKHIDSLFHSLSDGKVKLSAVENEIRTLLETSAQICQIGDNIIAAQENLIQTMKVQRIEEDVVVDSLLKNCLRLYTGSDNSGKTASSIIINEIHRRKGNTLLLDITRTNKASNYLTFMTDLEQVIEESNRGQYDLLYCKNIRKIDFNKLINYLQDCVHYYRYIDIITDSETQLKSFEKYALSISIFLKPDMFSINRAKDFIKSITTDNIAKRICIIDSPVEPVEIFQILNVSPTEFQYVNIPNMAEINKAMLRKINPGLNKDLRIIFEEKFI